MKTFKAIPVFILLLAEILCRYRKTRARIKGYLCDAQDAWTALPSNSSLTERQMGLLGEKGGGKHLQNATEAWRDDHVSGRNLPTLVVAGVSIALVLLCILIVAIFWYAWKKSQEGSIELNPIPYGEAGVSLRTVSVPENQQEWPFERAVQ